MIRNCDITFTTLWIILLERQELCGAETRSVVRSPSCSLYRGHDTVWMARLPSGLRQTILSVYFPKLSEAALLCGRQRGAFDPRCLASSSLSQPLEPSLGNWLTVWSPSDSTLLHTFTHIDKNVYLASVAHGPQFLIPNTQLWWVVCSGGI